MTEKTYLVSCPKADGKTKANLNYIRGGIVFDAGKPPKIFTESEVKKHFYIHKESDGKGGLTEGVPDPNLLIVEQVTPPPDEKKGSK